MSSIQREGENVSSQMNQGNDNAVIVQILESKKAILSDGLLA